MQTITNNPQSNHRVWTLPNDCAVCGSKAIGINFGAPTCAPCKGSCLHLINRFYTLFISC
jgi:hypothetical protein